MTALSLACVITLAGFHETAAWMVRTWIDSSTYSYCLLIAPIVGLLVWRLREQLRELYPSGSVIGMIAYLGAALLWLGGNIADVQLVQQVALVAMLDSLVWTILGTAVARLLAFPLFFLFFSVPFGDSIVPVLQQWTASFVVAALRLSGIPAVQDGFVLSTPNCNWQVAEACSGIRYLIASIVIGVLVSGVAYRSWKRRIVFLVFSALLPIIANALRAYGIVVLAYLTGNAVAVGVDHVIYGFIFFSVITVVLMVVAIRWYEPQSEADSSRAAHPSVPVGNPAFLVATVLCTAIVVWSATRLSDYLWSRVPVAQGALVLAAPAGWEPITDLDNEWAPDPQALRQRQVESFSDGSTLVSALFGWYQGGRRGVELIDTHNLVGDSGTWTVLGRSTRKISIKGRPAVVAEHEVMHGRDHRLVWLWYSVGSELTANPYRLRLIEAKNRLLGQPKVTALYAVSSPYHSDPAEASSALDSFLK